MYSAQLAASILLEPRSAFDALRVRPTFWMPLAVVALGFAGVTAWYLGWVDLAWLVASSDDAHRGIGTLPRGAIMAVSLAAALLGIPLVRLVEAGYYALVGKLGSHRQSFRFWLALACWSSFPLVIAIAAMALSLPFHRDGQVTQEQLQLLSLNEILFHVPAGNRWHGLLSTLTILHPWMWWLTVLGVKAGAASTTAFAAAVALLPVAVFYGGWAIMVLATA